MEFNENRAGQHFAGLIWLWHAFKKWRERKMTRRLLQGMSDARLRDIGLSREDADKWS